jgi:hypothetical protein
MTRDKVRNRQWAGWLDKTLLDGLEELATRNHRTVTDEMSHAIQRHLESPPVVILTTTTPPITPAVVEAPPPAPKRPRGRPRKKTS